jgi:Spy/CpxP family protein refolding chaperone
MIISKLGLMILLAGAAGLAQEPPPPPPQPKPPIAQASPLQIRNEAQRKRIEENRQIMLGNMQNRLRAAAAQSARPARPLLERALGVPGGRWWTRPEMAQKLGLTADQTKKMDETFQQFRLKLIDLNASVQREEAIMEPLIGAEQPDEAKIVAQIDKVALARAELEKANARMLLGIRRLLTPEQWNKLKAEAPAAAQPLRR